MFRVEVSDTGCGVPDIVKNKLFKNPFYLDDSEIERFEAQVHHEAAVMWQKITKLTHGLGCFNARFSPRVSPRTCNKLPYRIQMEKVDGKCGLEQNPELGTTFWLEFPCLHVSDETAMSDENILLKEKKEYPKAVVVEPKYRALIIEDSIFYRKLFHRTLSRHGYKQVHLF